MKKILVPIDFSSDAENALDFAIQFNKKIHGQIVLLHVLELPSTSVNYGADIGAATAEVVYRRELIDGISTQLHEWEARVVKAGQQAAIRMEYGSPYKSIGKEVAGEKSDWVIMGSRGISDLSHFFLGSNAERVIRYSECPVITIKDKVDMSTFKNFVFASDLSREQDKVATKVKEIQALLGLNMHVVRVKTPSNFLVEEAARGQLEDFAKRNELVDYTLNTIDADFSEEGIVTFADSIKASMIVMGTHGRKGIAHIIGGSRAEEVANRSAIPVLTLKI